MAHATLPDLEAKSNRQRMSLAARIVWGLSGVGLLLFLFYAEENSRHTDAWQAYRKSVGLDRHKLDWKAALPKPVPDEENFAATPLLKAIGMRGHGQPEIARRFTSVSAGAVPAGGFLADAFAAKPADLQGFVNELIARGTVSQKTNANLAQLALQGFQPIATDLAELRQASLRRYAQFPVQGDDPISLRVPDFVVVRALCHILCLRADAFLAAAQPEEALKDLQVVFRLSDALEPSLTLVSAMIRVALNGMVLGPFRDGVVQGSWSSQQLTELQKRFENVNLLAAVAASLDSGERAGIHYLVEKRPEKLLESIGANEGHASLGEFLAARLKLSAIRSVPQSWYHRALMNYDQPMAECVAAFNPREGLVDLDRIQRTMARAQATMNRGGPFTLLMQVALPNLSHAHANAARTQTMFHLAVVVCALERFKLETGSYPASLDGLTPKYLTKIPHDVLKGRSLAYRLPDNGRYRLSSKAPAIPTAGTANTTHQPECELAWPN